MIVLKTAQEIEKMRAASKVVIEILAALKEAVRPGVTTGDLYEIAARILKKYGAASPFKGYPNSGGGKPFPAFICTSVNDQVVHGIPSKKRGLREGDIVSVDVGALLNGYHGDSAATFAVGNIRPEDARLLQVTEESLYAAIEQVRMGNRLGDVSAAVQKYVEARGFNVVRQYVGHGIGQAMHEEPQIPNYGTVGRGVKLRPGMVLAIEPMVNAGTASTHVLADEWTVVTDDSKHSAHFEHTVAITENGPDILTR
jgi:methionyl aminopeptidase